MKPRKRPSSQIDRRLTRRLRRLKDGKGPNPSRVHPQCREACSESGMGARTSVRHNVDPAIQFIVAVGRWGGGLGPVLGRKRLRMSDCGEDLLPT
jgi:hypothetical protein